MKSNAIIVGCPNSFDLYRQLDTAKSVKFAMAFAKPTGWDLLRESLLKGDKRIEIIVGLNFGITDPNLLDEWLRYCLERPKHFVVMVAPKLPVFHPKVMIAHLQDDSRIAIVGSGNLTRGGQRHNVECGIFVHREEDIRELERWFNGLKSVLLNEKIISAYRPLYKQARKATAAALDSRELAAALSNRQSGWYDDLFLEEFEYFLLSPDGVHRLEGRIKAANRIRAALRMPQFNFTKEGWLEFYGIKSFGRIRQAYKRKMTNDIGSLRRACRFIAAKPLNVTRLDAILNINGSHHVRGMGRNQISKILTVCERYRWPVLNDRVELTLGYFGYQVKHGSVGYLTFAQDMQDCLTQRKRKPDFWAFDAFCESKSREIDR